jgi:hypothetical protein
MSDTIFDIWMVITALAILSLSLLRFQRFKAAEKYLKVAGLILGAAMLGLFVAGYLLN